MDRVFLLAFAIVYCLLPIANCLLPIANCLLPIANCLLPIALLLHNNLHRFLHLSNL